MPSWGLPPLGALGQRTPPPQLPAPPLPPSPPSMPSPPQAPRMGPPPQAQGMDPFGGQYGPADPGASPLQPFFRQMLADQMVQQLGAQLPAFPGLPGSPGAPSSAPSATPATAAPTGASSSSSGASAGPAVVTGNPASFLAAYTPDAQAASAQSGLPASLLLAISAHETGWGQSMPGNEMFGIKAVPGESSVNTPTQEYVNGKYVNTNADWTTYPTTGDAFKGFWTFLNNNSRYKPALAYWQQTGDQAGFLQRINQAGYATNPNWWQEVLATQQTVNHSTGQ